MIIYKAFAKMQPCFMPNWMWWQCPRPYQFWSIVVSFSCYLISSSAKNIFKKSNDCLSFEDTCGPVNFSPIMNFILGSVLLDSSQTVHFELLESLPKSDRSQWPNAGKFLHYEKIAQGLKKTIFFTCLTWLYLIHILWKNNYINKENNHMWIIE